MPEEETQQEELVDLILPPGTPRKAIRDVINLYDVELVGVTRSLTLAKMDHDERELLSFRGKREEVEKVREFIYHEIKKFLGDE